MADTIAVEVDNLRKTYKNGFMGRRQVNALKGVSLQVNKGEIFGLLGPNGAGKTTMIKILLGIVHKSEGSGKLLGVDIRRRIARANVGYLPEHYRIPNHHTGVSAMKYYGALSNVPAALVQERSPKLLEIVGIADRAKSPVSSYSKGMKQRLGLALAMISDPDLLILDEPTDGVDPVGRKDMRELFTKLKKDGKTIFLNSHLLQETELVCDRVAILHEGELKQLASVEQLRRKTGDYTTIDVIGAAKTIKGVVDETMLMACDNTGGDAHTLTLDLKKQEDLDKTIDALRQVNISIRAIAKQSQSLEEAFISIVEGGKQ